MIHYDGQTEYSPVLQARLHGGHVYQYEVHTLSLAGQSSIHKSVPFVADDTPPECSDIALRIDGLSYQSASWGSAFVVSGGKVKVVLSYRCYDAESKIDRCSLAVGGTWRRLA